MKKVMSNSHKSRTRERASVPGAPTSRTLRRTEARKAATSGRKARVRERLRENPALVRFAF